MVRRQLSQVDETVIKPGKEIPSLFILFEPARGEFIHLSSTPFVFLKSKMSVRLTDPVSI